MSAPSEIWADPMGRFSTARKPHPVQAQQVRYLCADLTCGECEKRLNVCPHHDSGYDTVEADEKDPACMAFEEKK